MGNFSPDPRNHSYGCRAVPFEEVCHAVMDQGAQSELVHHDWPYAHVRIQQHGSSASPASLLIQ
jgi:hypothetical protein